MVRPMNVRRQNYCGNPTTYLYSVCHDVFLNKNCLKRDFCILILINFAYFFFFITNVEKLSVIRESIAQSHIGLECVKIPEFLSRSCFDEQESF